MPIKYTTTGSFGNTNSFLKKVSDGSIFRTLEHYGQMGVDALALHTPVDSGLTASMWRYKVSRSRNTYSITWYNGNTAAGTPVAILLQYGHATGTGGYVQGRDYINPAMQPLFDQIAADVWKAVTSA